MASVFISYGREDAAKVSTLALDIGGLGHQAWFDQDLTGGQAWWDHILKTIRQCDVFVSVLSPGSLDSPACRLESAYAAALGKRVLPVLVAEGVAINLLPPVLAKIQYVDYRRADKEALKALAKALGALPPPVPLPDPLPEPPAAPVSYLGSLAEQVGVQRALSFEEQSAILVRLKRGLRDEDSDPEQVRALLKKMRSREDLYARVGEEIDELLQAPARVARYVSPPSIVGEKIDELLPAPPVLEYPILPARTPVQPAPVPVPVPPPKPEYLQPEAVGKTRAGMWLATDWLFPKAWWLAIIGGGLAQYTWYIVFWGALPGLYVFVSAPDWALIGSTVLVAMAVWRRVREKPTALRLVCVGWPLGGGVLIASAVLSFTHAEVYGSLGLTRPFVADVIRFAWLGALVPLSGVTIMLMRETTAQPLSPRQAIWVVTGGQVATLFIVYAAFVFGFLYLIASFLALSLALLALWNIVRRVLRRRVE